MIALISAMRMDAMDVAFIIIGYELPAMDAPLLSMQMFAEVSGDITVA